MECARGWIVSMPCVGRTKTEHLARPDSSTHSHIAAQPQMQTQLCRNPKHGRTKRKSRTRAQMYLFGILLEQTREAPAGAAARARTRAAASATDHASGPRVRMRSANSGRKYVRTIIAPCILKTLCYVRVCVLILDPNTECLCCFYKSCGVPADAILWPVHLCEPGRRVPE